LAFREREAMEKLDVERAKLALEAEKIAVQREAIAVQREQANQPKAAE
jgi:hypothetical protein